MKRATLEMRFCGSFVVIRSDSKTIFQKQSGENHGTRKYDLVLNMTPEKIGQNFRFEQTLVSKLL